MHPIIKTGITVVLALALTASAETQRSVRRIGPGAARPVERTGPMEADQDTTAISYHDTENTSYIWSIPNNYKGNDFGDKYHNVRFTPPFIPFEIVEAHIPLFDMWGEMGTPDMRVIVWQSGSLNDEPGYPVEPIDSVDVPFESLVFGGEEVEYNVIDLRPLEITFYGWVDFHIGVDIITDTTTDTLTIYSDDGESNPTDRSVLWDGVDEDWIKVVNLPGVEEGRNFAIRAVVTNWFGVPTVLDPAGPPEMLVLDPAWPNPFNRQVRVGYSVLPGVPYTAALFDQFGRRVKSVAVGVGNGDGELLLDADGLTTGAYYLRFTAGNRTAVQRMVYIR